MSDRRLLQAQYQFLILPAMDGDFSSLEVWEREALAFLYVKEVRKGGFVASDGPDKEHVNAFLQHARTHFADSEDLRVVLDFQPRLLASASDLAHRPRPIESIILYATWCEHWLNATLITAGLAAHLSDDDVALLVRSTYAVKLGWLWKLLRLPPLPESLSTAMQVLADLRNEHVHYKWKGHDPDDPSPPHARLEKVCLECPALVTSLLDWEVEILLKDQIALANRLFSVSIGPAWKQAALQRPASAGPLFTSSLPDV